MLNRKSFYFDEKIQFLWNKKVIKLSFVLYKCLRNIQWYLWITSPASIEKGSEEYTENIVTKVSRTTLVLVKSVPVHSMKTFFVFSVILLWSPLIIGGIDKTTPFESYMIGYTGLSFIICRYCFIWLSVWKVEKKQWII